MINGLYGNFQNGNFLFYTIYKHIHFVLISFPRNLQHKIQQLRRKSPKSCLSIRNFRSCHQLKNFSGKLVAEPGFPGCGLIQISYAKNQCSGISSCPHQELLHILRKMLAVCIHNSHSAVLPQFCPNILKSGFYSLAFPLVFFMVEYDTFLFQSLETFPVLLFAAVIYYQDLIFQFPEPVHQLFQTWLRVQSRYDHNKFHGQTLFLSFFLQIIW